MVGGLYLRWKVNKKVFCNKKSLVGEWVGFWVNGWEGAMTVLRIAYSNQKLTKVIQISIMIRISRQLI